MIFYQVKNKEGKILAENMQEFSRREEFENNKSFSINKNGQGLKGSYEFLDNISIWIVVENENDLLKSSKLFKKTFVLYRTIALELYGRYKKDVDTYSHVLNTIQAQMKQKLEDFADQELFYGDTYEDSVKKISDTIEKDITVAADLICYLQKRVIDMRAQLLAAEIIHSKEQYEVKLTEVSLKRAILSQCTPFLEDLHKNSIKIRFYFEDDCKIVVDKNMFSLIMYNFFSNATKYAKQNSEIRLNYSSEEKSLDISMISLKMDKSELTNLHKDGVRGVHAKNFPGKGIGLFVLDKALELMKKKQMYISPCYEKSLVEGDMTYVENHFQFLL